MQFDLRKNLDDADMTLDRALERCLHIEAVTRTEEKDNEPPVSAIQSKKNLHLLKSINDLVRTLQTNQPKRQKNQNFHRKERGQMSFYAVVSDVQEKTEIEIEVLIAKPEAMLSIDEPITKVERVRRHREVRTEAQIDRTRNVPSSRR